MINVALEIADFMVGSKLSMISSSIRTQNWPHLSEQISRFLSEVCIGLSRSLELWWGEVGRTRVLPSRASWAFGIAEAPNLIKHIGFGMVTRSTVFAEFPFSQIHGFSN